MAYFTCASCRLLLRQAQRALPSYRTFYPPPPTSKDQINIAKLLSKPSWSVRSLLPNAPPAEEITPKQLHHLLRLSALPQPKSPEEETKMLETLHTQLHFVREIQNVNTTGVEPLQSIRDESEEGIKNATIGLKEMIPALRKEEVKGRSRRPRMIKEALETKKGVEDWDVLGTASEKVDTPGGSYFVVRSAKEKVDIPEPSI